MSNSVNVQSVQSLAQWLKERCKKEGLSLREAARKAGLSHATIAGIVRGRRASPKTIRQLAAVFAPYGINQRLALEDHLLILAGCRTPREGERTEAWGQLLDTLLLLNERQIEWVERFAHFLSEIELEIMAVSRIRDVSANKNPAQAKGLDHP